MKKKSHTTNAHFLSETDIDEIRIGLRVQAVFEEKRKGSLLDIKHFAPIGERGKPREMMHVVSAAGTIR